MIHLHAISHFRKHHLQGREGSIFHLVFEPTWPIVKSCSQKLDVGVTQRQH